jgi:hypothetical protein
MGVGQCALEEPLPKKVHPWIWIEPQLKKGRSMCVWGGVPIYLYIFCFECFWVAHPGNTSLIVLAEVPGIQSHWAEVQGIHCHGAHTTHTDPSA